MSAMHHVRIQRFAQIRQPMPPSKYKLIDLFPSLTLFSHDQRHVNAPKHASHSRHHDSLLNRDDGEIQQRHKGPQFPTSLHNGPKIPSRHVQDMVDGSLLERGRIDEEP